MSKKNHASFTASIDNDSAENTESKPETVEVKEESAIAACINVTESTVSIGVFSAPMATVLRLSAKNKKLGPFDVVAARYFRAKGVKVVCENEEAKAIVDRYPLIENSHITSVSVGVPTREKAERVTTKDLIDQFPGCKFTRINLGAAEALGIEIANSDEEVLSAEGNCWYKGYLIRK